MTRTLDVRVRTAASSGLARLASGFDRVASAADRVRGIAPTVLGPSATSERLLTERVSFSRLGDGEFLIIFGKNIGYQQHHPVLATRLLEVLHSEAPDLMVGIPDVFGDHVGATPEQQRYWREHLARYRHGYLKALNLKKVYYDASTTRVLSRLQDVERAREFFSDWRTLWEDRDVVFVEGAETRLGVGHDLFDNVRSLRRIICPARDAFSRYEEILTVASAQKRGVLFICALGPTATVLCHDLSREGYQALDLGHFDIEYEWTHMGRTGLLVPGKYVNEVTGGDHVSPPGDWSCESQAIAVIPDANS